MSARPLTDSVCKESYPNLLKEERQEIVNTLVALGQERGFLNLDQVLDHAPPDLDVEDLTSLLQDLEAQGIEVEGAEQVQPERNVELQHELRLRHRRSNSCQLTRKIRGRIL
ncbi:MAG: hypothetical protein Ct9H300mP25_12110 [Acidobacteriota bacterium]|nr:MAG: hypothetical protein Ct9H300mP25_12110 [Acidobacteriota bacterium]